MQQFLNCGLETWKKSFVNQKFIQQIWFSIHFMHNWRYKHLRWYLFKQKGKADISMYETETGHEA
jgi:hypothetical protein